MKKLILLLVGVLLFGAGCINGKKSTTIPDQQDIEIGRFYTTPKLTEPTIPIKISSFVDRDSGVSFSFPTELGSFIVDIDNTPPEKRISIRNAGTNMLERDVTIHLTSRGYNKNVETASADETPESIYYFKGDSSLSELCKEYQNKPLRLVLGCATIQNHQTFFELLDTDAYGVFMYVYQDLGANGFLTVEIRVDERGIPASEQIAWEILKTIQIK